MFPESFILYIKAYHLPHFISRNFLENLDNILFFSLKTIKNTSFKIEIYPWFLQILINFIIHHFNLFIYQNLLKIHFYG